MGLDPSGTVFMHIDLRDLRLFIHIAESKSLTRGAERSHLSCRR
jgi:hypothetical protein